MGFWDFMTQTMGLLGRVSRVDNKERKFGSAQTYLIFKVEHDGESVDGFGVGEQEILMATDKEMQEMRERAQANPEDVEAFLNDNKARDKIGDL